MDHSEIKLRCLEIAMKLGAKPENIEELAEQLFRFVTS